MAYSAGQSEEVYTHFTCKFISRVLYDGQYFSKFRRKRQDSDS